jgi:hypothetical protein
MPPFSRLEKGFRLRSAGKRERERERERESSPQDLAPISRATVPRIEADQTLLPSAA